MKTVQAASQVAYDLIGDVHGQADKLAGLLRLMGYMPEQRGYRAPKGRKAVFLGDLIDRGPEQVRTLEIARPWSIRAKRCESWVTMSSMPSAMPPPM